MIYVDGKTISTKIRLYLALTKVGYPPLSRNRGVNFRRNIKHKSMIITHTLAHQHHPKEPKGI